MELKVTITFSACLKLSLRSWRLSRIVVTWTILNFTFKSEFSTGYGWSGATSPIRACWGESVLSSPPLLKVWRELICSVVQDNWRIRPALPTSRPLRPHVESCLSKLQRSRFSCNKNNPACFLALLSFGIKINIFPATATLSLSISFPCSLISRTVVSSLSPSFPRACLTWTSSFESSSLFYPNYCKDFWLCWKTWSYQVRSKTQTVSSLLSGSLNLHLTCSTCR